MLCWPSKRSVLAAVLALALGGFVAAGPALARDDHGHHHGHDGSSSSQETTGDSGPVDDGSTDGNDDQSVNGTVLTGSAQTITAELTGYSYQDNTPPSSAKISAPVLHKVAGGTGTFADPITTAVPGHSGQGMETPKGTRLYVPRLKRYFIVEDSGATKMSTRHFDLWVGGQGFPKSASDKCMNSYTGREQVVLNPGAGMPVTVGPLTGANGCRV